jgi:hypothetical protein
MTKRSAVAIAAILVSALALGALATSLGLTGPTPAVAGDGARPHRVVQVQRRTITIHRDGATSSAGTGGAVALGSSAGRDDDSDLDEAFEHEDEHGSEDALEVEHADDGFEVEDD